MGNGSGGHVAPPLDDADLPRANTRDKHKWHLINGIYDATDYTPDEHAEFIRSVREFHCQLLTEFEPKPPADAVGVRSSSWRLRGGSRSTSFASSEESDSDASQGSDKDIAWLASWRIAEADDYVARFAQPYPARLVWAALPQTQAVSGRELIPIRSPFNWPSDFNCAPLVCVVLRDQPDQRYIVERVILQLANHNVGLIINVRAVKEPDLRFILVGLRPPQLGSGLNGSLNGSASGGAYFGNFGPSAPAGGFSLSAPIESSTLGGHGMRSGIAGGMDGQMTRAEQRQVVWAAVDEVLKEVAGERCELIEDVYMLRSVYLYDRLFKWLGRRKTLCGPLRLLSQEELDLIVHEFGEETATHFLFVNQYLRHLRVAAWVSVVCAMITLLDIPGWLGDRVFTEKVKRVMLVCFLPTWGFHFLASWRSSASKAGFRWLGSLGSVQNSVKQVARAQAMESASEQRARYLRILGFCVPLLLFQMLTVFSVTVTFVCFEVYIYDVVWELMTSNIRLIAFVIYNVGFGLAFILILGVFHPLSKVVTTWERHPDKELFDWHFTMKIYSNWFLAIFLYFFVIAFCYIPFGDNIANGIASLYPDDSSASPDSLKVGREKVISIHGALQSFRPDLHRLAMDVALFFLLQDSARLMQVLVPVVRAAWGLGKMKGVQNKRHRHKRRAIFRAVLSMFSCRCRRPSDAGSISRISRSSFDFLCGGDAGGDLTKPGVLPPTVARFRRNMEAQMLQRAADLDVSGPQNAAQKKGPAMLLDEPGVFVVYCAIESVEIAKANDSEHSDVFMFGQAGEAPGAESNSVIISCTLDLPEGRVEAPSVSSHVRICNDRSRQSAFVEEPEDVLPDVLTLTLHPRVLTAQAAAAHRRSAAARAAALGPMPPGTSSSSRPAAGSGGKREAGGRDINDSDSSDETSSDEEEVSTLTAGGKPEGLCGLVEQVGLSEAARHSSSAYVSTELLRDLGAATAAAAALDGDVGAGGGSGGPSVRLRLRADLLCGSVDGASSFEVPFDVPLGLGARHIAHSKVTLGPVQVRIVAGLVRGSTHVEALGKVPVSFRAARICEVQDPVMLGSEALSTTAAEEEQRAWDDGSLPWLWWDEELSSRYWEEVFELFAVKETFETFELYAHLATQFSYVSLFGIAVPICPLLAWFFASVEMRQDQLRLLWLSRPPQPHEGTLRFKRTVSLDAWYMIVRFTCYLSVIVNLLLWGLTYSGFSSTAPSDWGACEWWKAIAIFLVFQQAFFIVGSLINRAFSKLDHETAAAYLRRCSRLQHSIFYREDDESPSVTRRQASRYASRRRLTRSPTRGLSSLV